MALGDQKRKQLHEIINKMREDFQKLYEHNNKVNYFASFII